MDAPGAQQRSGGNANDNQNHPQAQKNLSGLKHAMHGTSYQLQQTIVVTLANAKKSKYPANNFTFTVTAEGRDESKTQNRNEKCTPDKFDDIKYEFKHGSITGTINIQTKHKQQSSKITLNDLIAVSKHDFCIDQYFKSFRDKPLAKTKKDVEGSIICTNADLDDDAKVLWKPVDAAVLGDPTTSLDTYISSLFIETRGKCYRLKTHYKHAAFARLLINAIKSKEQLISWKTPLFKEYRQFIMNIIVKKDNTAQDCVWKFKDSFIYSSNNIPNPGYATFRNEFEDQYRKEFQTGDSVWKHLEDNNEIHVSEDCLFDQNSEKSTMLAWLLIKAITSKKGKVSWEKPLFKEYRAAILDVIDKNNYTTEDDYLLCKFNDKFVDGTSNDSILNYNTFRKDFEDQYQKAFNFDGTVWEDLKNRNQIYVAESFLNDKKKQNITSSTKKIEFPKNITESADDKVDESLNEIFCDQFRLVCGTYNQEELDIAIGNYWKMLHAGDDHMTIGCVETKLASDWLFKTNFDWLMKPFENSLHSEDIIKDFENIHGTLACMKLEPISDKLRKNVLGSPFRISDKTLEESKLYNQVKTESLLQIEAFDIQFGVTLLSDILESQGHTTILFLEYSDFIHNLDTIEAVLRGKTHYCLVIICREYEAFKKVQGIVRKWKTYLNHKEDIPKNPAKHIFLIRKASDIPSDLSCFRFRDLKSESWDQFCKESISLCGMTISPRKIFQSSFTDLQIEEIIKLLDWGKKMEKSNEILNKFEKIKDIYVHRGITIDHHSTRTDTPKVTDIQKAKSNLSGLKHALHGASFQLKLGIVVSLKNAKKSLDPANSFTFAVVADGLIAGIFGDIVYTFKDDGKAGILKIQAKCKLGSPPPTITVKEFTINSDTKNPFAIRKNISIKIDIDNIIATLAHMKLKAISDKLRKEVVGFPFRVRHDIIKASDLYRQVETESFLQVETFDIDFGVKLLSDILDLQSKDQTTTLFLNKFDLHNNSDAVDAVLRCKTHYCLVIIYLEAFETVQSLVQKWKKDIVKNPANQIILIRKTHDIPSDLNCFCLRDLTEESWEVFRKSISSWGTAISPLKILENSFRERSIEEIYDRILSDYDLGIKNVDIEHTWWSDKLKNKNYALREEITFEKITTWLKKDTNVNIPKKNQETIYGYEGKKVVILLGEAGHGKSTNLTWLAWHLRQRNPSFWVVRCNLSDHCTDFKPFTPEGIKNTAGKVNEIDETKAIRLLYKLAYSSLQLEREMAEICCFLANCLDLLDGKANVSKDLTKQHGFSNSIVLHIFKEKFNAGEIVLLLDGFDEIAPDYKEVVLKFLSLFEKFEGVKKIHLTSRPYGFKKQFKRAFMDPLFFQFKPLLVQDKASMLYKMMKEKWRNRNIDDDITKSLCYMLLCSLGDMSDVPLNLMMAVDVLEDSVYPNENMNNDISSEGKLFEAILNLSKPSFIVEEFVKVKILHRLYDKKGLDKKNVDKPGEGKRFEKEINNTKLLHGLLALWIFFDENELATILSADETLQAENYKKLILDGDEKTGIIHGIQNDAPVFIHRSFAEYLAAWWLIQRQKEGKKQDRIQIASLESFWGRERKELRKYIDIVLTQNHPLPHAIIECDWQAVESLLSTSQNSTNQNPLFVRDDGERTPLHLLAIHFDFERKWLNLFEDSIISDIINCEENIFGWTALDYAFQMDKPRLIFYLLHHGASINVDVLYEHIASARNDQIRKAAKYARYVMQYLSQQAIEYESHDACKKMKQFCDKVVADLVNKSSATQRQILEDNIREDTVWMLESVIQAADRMHFDRGMISYFDLALHRNSCFMLKYLMAHDPSVLKDDNFMKCALYAALKDYKIEFKYFVDLYCSRATIKDFQFLPIQSDAECYLIDYFNDGEMDRVCVFTNNICWEKQGIPTELMIDENILSMLIVCVVTVRPSMLRYLKESCKLNLCAGLVFPLAMITNNVFSELSRETKIKPSKAYECLLDQASNISDVEANTMLRLAITSNLLEFSKCLIERFRGIDFQAVDELNGWNVFHLCASNQRSFWAEQIIEVDDDDDDDDGSRASYVDDKNDLFRYMQAKASDMDCFGVFDKKGRSILHLAMKAELRGIVEYIVARKLGQNDFKEIRNLCANAIPNITLCYHAILEISKSVEEKWWHQEILCMLAKQIAKISLTDSEESQELNSGRLLLQENAKELYLMAMKCRSLYLMYYLHREFPNAIPPLIYGADRVACTARSLRSLYFLDVTKWLLNPNDVDQHANLYEVVEKCDDEGYDLTSVNLEILVKQVEATVTTNRTVEEVCKLKLLALAVCLKEESMIRHLCETLKVNIDWKVLIDIMEIAHQSYIYEPGTEYIDSCAFCWPDFVPISKYLFERITNLGEIDAEGANVLHLAAQKGLGCMAKFLIKHNMVNVMTVNEQNGWNIFHYYGSCKSIWKCCETENDFLLPLITKRVLEITSDGIPFSSLTESRRNKLKELCFNSNEGRKSVIHIAVEAGDIWTAEYIIQCSLGITYIDKPEITNPCEYLHVRECYDEVYQIAAQLPFNGYCDYLLHRLVKIIQRCSREPIEHITEQGNVEDHIVEDACRSAIMYRSVTALEHLMIACEDQMNRALARSTNNELIACMMECIRRNRSSMFKVLVGHYRTLQGIHPTVKVEFENEENDNIDSATIDENEIEWRIIDEFAQDVTMNRDFLHLLILSVAYGRLSMTQFLVEKLQLKVSKSLLQLIMKVLKDLWDENCKTATPVYKYLASRCEGNPNFLHLCIQAERYNMLKYLIKEKNLDPNEVDSENGWNAGHYFVSGPISSGYKVFTWLVEGYNMD